MPVGGFDTYRIRGRHPEAEAATLEAALIALLDFWNTRRSLVMHRAGNLVITMTIAGKDVIIEITDRKVIDNFHEYGAKPVLDAIAKDMGLSEADAMALLDKASAHVEVGTLRNPSRPDAWKSEPDFKPDVVLPKEVPVMLRELAKEYDEDMRRLPGRRRNKAAQQILNIAVRTGRQQKLSYAELARQTGIPSTTLRDASKRMERAEKVSRAIGKREPGQRLTAVQARRVMAEIETQGGNAAKAARVLGLPPRTVREVRQRESRKPEPRVGSWDADTKAQVLDQVREGVNATEAGRVLGVPARTARGWVRAARLGRKRG